MKMAERDSGAACEGGGRGLFSREFRGCEHGGDYGRGGRRLGAGLRA